MNCSWPPCNSFATAVTERGAAKVGPRRKTLPAQGIHEAVGAAQRRSGRRPPLLASGRNSRGGCITTFHASATTYSCCFHCRSLSACACGSPTRNMRCPAAYGVLFLICALATPAPSAAGRLPAGTCGPGSCSLVSGRGPVAAARLPACTTCAGVTELPRQPPSRNRACGRHRRRRRRRRCRYGRRRARATAAAVAAAVPALAGNRQRF